MAKKIISIKVECEEDEEKIMYYLKQFCIDNFKNQAEICVTGKDKTLYFPTLFEIFMLHLIMLIIS